MKPDDTGHVCNCERIDCWHPVGRCEEPPIIRWGVCATCKHYPPPPRCLTCGQPIRKQEPIQ